MGSLRKRGGAWFIRYYDRTGKRHEVSGGAKKGRALRKLKQIEGDFEKGVPWTPAFDRYSFDDAAVDIINEYTVNKRRTVRDLKRRIDKHLMPFFGGRRMVSITAADVYAYIAHRQGAKESVRRAYEVTRPDGSIRKVPAHTRVVSGTSNAEINREIRILTRMFTLATRAGKLQHKPNLPTLRENNVRSGFFERDEFEAVRAHLPADIQPVITFAYLTGWRVRSEILPLEWRQVDLDAGTVRLDPGTTKNGEGRLLPFGDRLPELRDLLEDQWRRTQAVQQAQDAIIARVFHRNGQPIRDFRGAWKRACEAAGCPQRIRHDFRRTAVRNLERAGVSRSVAMKITGHLTESVYRRYAIVSEADISEGLGKLAALTTQGGKRGDQPSPGKVRRIRTARR